MRAILTSLSELAGAVLITVGMFDVSSAAGKITGGVALVVLGIRNA